MLKTIFKLPEDNLLLYKEEFVIIPFLNYTKYERITLQVCCKKGRGGLRALLH